MFKQNKQPAGEGGQTLGQAARGGCGTSILQLFKPHTSREPSCSQLDPSSGPSHGCCTQKSSGHKPGGVAGCAQAGQWGGRSPEAVGTGCQPGELPPHQLPPSPGCTARWPPPHWPLPALACPWGQRSNRRFTRKFNVI